MAISSTKKTLVLIIISSLIVGFTGGFYFNKFLAPVITPIQELINRDSGRPENVDFSLFWNVWDLLQKKYVDKNELNFQDMVYGATDGLVRAVGDPYTVFLKPKENESFNQEISGSFGGVGIEIGIRDEIITVIAPLPSTPAEKAGILAGDKIIRIGEKSTEGMKISEAVSLIRGPKGTPVVLTINRNGLASSKEYTIIRNTIRVPTVSWKVVEENVAHIRLHVFNKNVDSDFRKTVKEITKSKSDRIILDLRNNPGGILDSAISIASYFLEPGQVVIKEQFSGGRENDFRTSNNNQLSRYPLVVIINKGSASAAEILAGALRDNRGVVIVGEKSFGKGSVQEVVNLADQSSVKITTAKWFTPKGYSISDNGIEPDVKVDRTEEDINANRDPQLDKALEIIRGMANLSK